MTQKGPAKPKILIIEDDEFMTRILTREFAISGLTNYTIVTREKDVMSEFKRFAPNIIVLDILLPDKSGFEALKEVRKMKSRKKIPVFILTNYNNPHYRRLAKMLGVQEYLIKSNTLVSDLIKKIKEITSNRTALPQSKPAPSKKK